MTESIKFGPEWLRNSVANVSSNPNSTSSIASTTDSITCRPVLSDHRYGREEMLSLCDKSTRLPDVLTRFRRLYVGDWQMPLALQPNMDDERNLGTSTTWGPSHIRPLMPSSGLGRGGTGIIRGGSIERGRGRGRGLYHGSAGYARSTSLYDEEGRRTNLWLDRNGTETPEWAGSGSAVSPRKEYSRATSGMENWRKGTRDETGAGAGGDIDWRSSNNGTATGREKWTRSTSWRDGDATGDPAGPPNGQTQHQSPSPPTGVGINQAPMSMAPAKAPALYKKSWDEDHLPEWATESFDYGGTFDATGAFHDGERERDALAHEEAKEKSKMKVEAPKDGPVNDDAEPPNDQPNAPLNHFDDGRGDGPSKVPSKFMNFLNERSEPQPNSNFNVPSHNAGFNGAAQNSSTHIDRMKEVADLVANLIMEDEPKDANVVGVPPQPSGTQPPIMVDWFYLDPQGDTQGPFTAQDMSEWYKAGYFQESLMVRRSIDGAFMPLGQLVKVYGRNAPFMAATMMDPIQPPPPPPVEVDPYRIQQQQQQQQQQQHQHQQQRMAPPPDVNGWNMMTPEQQIVLLNMRLSHQRPPVPDPYVLVPDPYVLKAQTPANSATPIDLRRMMGSAATEFYQAAAPSNPAPVQPQEMDPIQQLLLQLQKTGGNGMNDPNQWMKPAAQPQIMMPSNVGGNLELLPSTQVMNHQQIPSALNQNQVPPQPSNNWAQAPMSIWDLPKADQVQMQMAQQSSQNQLQENMADSDIMHNGISDDSASNQFQTAPSKSHESKKKKQKDEEKVNEQRKAQSKESMAQPKLNSVGGKKKAMNEKQQQQKKEERTTQPAAPAPWVGHQSSSNGTSLAKIQKTEAQRRQGEISAQRERDQHKMEIAQKMDMQKFDGSKWAAPQTTRVKTLDEIQAEEQTAAAFQREREAADRAKRDAAKKESAIITNEISIWNSTLNTQHSMAWQQPKVWSGEQTSGSGFWEEPTKPTGATGNKSAQMLSKSQTMATITTNKKQVPPPPKKQMAPSKKTGEKKEKKDDNEFTTWCTRTLSSMNGNVDVPTFVSFLQDIESPFEVKDYIKMYLGETKECTEFAKQFLERRSKQRNQQRLQNAHIDDMCSPAPAITPSINSGINSDFQEVKGKNKKVKAKKVMKVVDGRILGFTATSASDRINVGDRDYGDI